MKIKDSAENAGKTQTILVVDDEVFMRDVIAHDFRKRGFKTLTAGNAKDAFLLVKNNKVDAVVSDIRMPDGDGLELLSEIKKHNLDVPQVVFITGFSEVIPQDAYHLGAAAMIFKPFNRMQLIHSVLKLLKPKSERWAEAFVGSKTNFYVQLTVDGIQTAIDSKTLSLGQGGMFVALQSGFPEINKRISFRIQSSNSPTVILEGDGIVRWVRKKSSQGISSGCGIEFLHLTHDARKTVLQVLEESHTRAYIPKT